MDIEKIHFFTINELRVENSMSIEDFCEGICSERQYWRYMNGSNLCPPDKLTKFLMKLNMTYNEYNYYLYIKSSVEYVEIELAYTSILRNKKPTAIRLMNKYKNHHFSTYEVELFYSLCASLLDVEYGNYTVREKISKYSKTINYPTIISKSHLNFREVSILLRIAHYEKEISVFDTADYLYTKLLNEDFYVSSNSRFALPALYVKLSKIFGSKKDLQKALDIANKGIKYSIKNYDSKALTNLYYLSALCEFKIGKRDQFSTNVAKCLATALSNQDTENYNCFYNLIQKTFLLDDDQITNLIINDLKAEKGQV
jgi:tetratricopeptide (TPR) repeat protein